MYFGGRPTLHVDYVDVPSYVYVYVCPVGMCLMVFCRFTSIFCLGLDRFMLLECNQNNIRPLIAITQKPPQPETILIANAQCLLLPTAFFRTQGGIGSDSGAGHVTIIDC